MRLATTTLAVLALAAGGALADAHGSIFDTADLQYGQTYSATTLLGARVHAVEEEYEMGAMLPAGSSAEWDDIGEIGDFLIGVDGSLQAVVVDVGGFLGLGEREVAIRWDALRPVYEDDDADNWLLTVPATQEMLENAPELGRDPA